MEGIKGRFEPGNEIGKETRFQKGNKWRFQTKYTEEYPDLLIAFFTDEEIIFPTIEGFAKKYRIDIHTVKNWCEKHPRFSIAYNNALAYQKERLVVGGLTRKFDSSFAKFIASNNHGMSDKSSNDTTITFNVDYGTSEIDEESN